MKKKGTRWGEVFIFVSSKTTTYIFICQDVVLFALPNKQTNKQNKDVGMGL